MKKISIISTMIFLMLFLSGCKIYFSYDFINPVDDIKRISIVTISYDETMSDDECGGIIQNELIQINEMQEFIEEFNQMECRVYLGDPRGIPDEDFGKPIIKIEYNNGEYELINHYGQAEFIQERGMVFYAGFRIFEEEEFKALIDKYIRIYEKIDAE